MSDLIRLAKKVAAAAVPSRADIESLLRTPDEKISELYGFADGIRQEMMGDGILLRGIVEFSSYCRNNCSYCGLNVDNSHIERYRLERGEILAAIADIASYGIRTVVLQSGEDELLDVVWFALLIEEIKERFGMAVTLSVGERPEADYRIWRKAGADRYLLKIETTDERLYSTMHRGRTLKTRLDCLKTLKELGYQVGSGIMVGLPGQTLGTIAADIAFFKENNFDMIGIGPFIPHNNTPFRDKYPGDLALTLRTIAVTRIAVKDAHMPATTALGSLMGKDHRQDGLKAGANVLMPNFTPASYKRLYEIYPGKRCVDEARGACVGCMGKMAEDIGRNIDLSVGHSVKLRA